MAQMITWEAIQAEAERRGYLLNVEGEGDHVVVHAAKKQFPHVKRSFSEHPGFSPDPHRADDYSLMQLYFWIRGYALDAGDDGKMELHRSMHHPLYDQNVRVAETWDYFWDGGIEGVQEKMLAWVAQVEQPKKKGSADRPQTLSLNIEGMPRRYRV